MLARPNPSQHNNSPSFSSFPRFLQSLLSTKLARTATTMFVRPLLALALLLAGVLMLHSPVNLMGRCAKKVKIGKKTFAGQIYLGMILFIEKSCSSQSKTTKKFLTQTRQDQYKIDIRRDLRLWPKLSRKPSLEMASSDPIVRGFDIFKDISTMLNNFRYKLNRFQSVLPGFLA